MSLESIFNKLSISNNTTHTNLLSASMAKRNNNPEADDTGLLQCGCYDVCHGVCQRFHHKRILAQHAQTWRNNIMTIQERKQLLSDVVEIKDYNTYDSTVQCSHCKTFYPAAFFVYPNETGVKYTPVCIPCVVDYALPNETTLRMLQEEYGMKKAEHVTHHYYAIARNLVRHPTIPLHNLVSYQTKATVPWYRLDTKYYFFDLNFGFKEDS